MSYSSSNQITPGLFFKWGAVGLATMVGVGGVLVGGIAGISAFSRSQDLAGARNQAHVARIHAANQAEVNQLLISANAQQVKIHQQQAQIREVDAQGIRAAQDEIAKTLTPLYVQFEMTQALERIADSGKNNTVVYIPSGAGGLPLVSGAAGQPQVGMPTSGG